MATARGTPINTLGGCRLIYGRAFDESRAAIKIMASESQGTTSSRVETRESPCRVTFPAFLWQCNYFYDILAVLCAVCCACVLCLCAVSGGCFVHVQVLPFAKQIKSKL